MKLNKKGFTLVELLAVIVILALLIIVVANTALPALTDARQKSLNTYGARVCEKAKEKCMSDYILSGETSCEYADIKSVMGKTNDEFSISTTIEVSIENDVTTIEGAIEDTSGNEYTCG